MKNYTVVGYYADNDQPFVQWVRAADPKDAAKRVITRYKDWVPYVVEVFAGRRKGLLGNEAVPYIPPQNSGEMKLFFQDESGVSGFVTPFERLRLRETAPLLF